MLKLFSEYGQSLRLVGETLDVCYDLVQAVKSIEYQNLLEKSSHDVKVINFDKFASLLIFIDDVFYIPSFFRSSWPRVETSRRIFRG